MKHSIHVLEHVACGNAHDVETFTAEHCIASSVAPGLVTKAVSLAVYLYDEAALEAGEVDRNLANWKLLSKLQSVRSFPQDLPEHDFRKAHLSPELTCALHLLDRRLEDAWAPSTARL